MNTETLDRLEALLAKADILPLEYATGVLYIVRSNPNEVLILDIDHRKDVYRMPKTKAEPADEMKMKEADFDAIMSKALGVAAPQDDEEKPEKRLSSFPPKKRGKS